MMARLLAGLFTLRGNHGIQQRLQRRSPCPFLTIIELRIRIDSIGNFRFLQLASHKAGKRHLRGRRRVPDGFSRRPASYPTNMTGFLLPVNGGIDTGANGGLFCRCP